MRRHEERHESSFGEEKMRSWWNSWWNAKDYIGFISERAFTSQMSLEDEISIIMDNVKKED